MYVYILFLNLYLGYENYETSEILKPRGRKQALAVEAAVSLQDGL